MLKAHASTEANFAKTAFDEDLGHGGTLTQLYAHHSGLGVPLAAVAEGGGQGGGAALVVQGRAAVVDCRVDGDCPHAGSVAVAVAVVVATAVSRSPHIDAAFASPPLKKNKKTTSSKK